MQGKWRGGNARKGIGLDTDCVVVGGFFFFFSLLLCVF